MTPMLGRISLLDPISDQKECNEPSPETSAPKKRPFFAIRSERVTIGNTYGQNIRIFDINSLDEDFEIEILVTNNEKTDIFREFFIRSVKGKPFQLNGVPIDGYRKIELKNGDELTIDSELLVFNKCLPPTQSLSAPELQLSVTEKAAITQSTNDLIEDMDQNSNLSVSEPIIDTISPKIEINCEICGKTESIETIVIQNEDKTKSIFTKITENQTEEEIRSVLEFLVSTVGIFDKIPNLFVAKSSQSCDKTQELSVNEVINKSLSPTPSLSAPEPQLSATEKAVITQSTDDLIEYMDQNSIISVSEPIIDTISPQIVINSEICGKTESIEAIVIQNEDKTKSISTKITENQTEKEIGSILQFLVSTVEVIDRIPNLFVAKSSQTCDKTQELSVNEVINKSLPPTQSLSASEPQPATEKDSQLIEDKSSEKDRPKGKLKIKRAVKRTKCEQPSSPPHFEPKILRNKSPNQSKPQKLENNNKVKANKAKRVVSPTPEPVPKKRKESPKSVKTKSEPKVLKNDKKSDVKTNKKTKSTKTKVSKTSETQILGTEKETTTDSTKNLIEDIVHTSIKSVSKPIEDKISVKIELNEANDKRNNSSKKGRPRVKRQKCEQPLSPPPLEPKILRNKSSNESKPQKIENNTKVKANKAKRVVSPTPEPVPKRKNSPKSVKTKSSEPKVLKNDKKADVKTNKKTKSKAKEVEEPTKRTLRSRSTSQK